jgi:hypothetical protein
LLYHFSDICSDRLISPLDISRPIYRCTSREIDWEPSISPASEVERSSQWEYRVFRWKIIRQSKEIRLIGSYPMEYNNTFGLLSFVRWDTGEYVSHV